MIGKYPFILILLVYCIVYQTVRAQRYTPENSPYKQLMTAFETSDWQKVIVEGNKIIAFNKINEFKNNDSLRIIESFDVFSKMAVAYTWLEKSDSANLLLQNFELKENLFTSQSNYAAYYKLATKGAIHFINNKFEKAFEALQLAYNEAFTDLKSNKVVYFDAVKNLVIYYIETSDYNKAIALLWNAMLIMENQKADASYLANFYYYLYLVYYSEANYKLALENSLKGLEELKLSNKIEDNYLYTRLLLAIGGSYFQLQEYYTAKEFLHKALDLQLNYYCDKNPDLALTFDYLARIYRKLENINLAIEYKRKAGDVYRNIYQSDKHFRVTFIYYSASIYMDEKVDKRASDFDPEIYESLNKFDYIFTHLPVNYPLTNNYMWVYQYTTQAFIYSKLKDYKQTVLYLKKALDIKLRKKGVNKAELVHFYEVIGHGFYYDRQFDSACFYYQKALETQQKTDSITIENSLSDYENSPVLLQLFSAQARCYAAKAATEQADKKKESYGRALNYYFKCDRLADELRAQINKREDKLFLGQQMDVVYKAALDVCFELSQLSDNKTILDKYRTQAFYFSQKNKGNLLEELITKSGAGKYAGIPDSLLSKEIDLRNKMAFWERQTQRKIVRDPNDYDHILIYYRKLIDKRAFNKTSFNDSLFKYTKEYEKLIDYYNVNYPRYYELKYSKNVRSISEIQSRLNTTSALLDYHINKNNIDICFISKDNFITKRIKTEESIDSLIKDYRESLSGYYRKDDFINKGYENFINKGNKIYEYLIKPIENQLKTKEKLIIIISEALSLLPFESLVADNNGLTTNDLAGLNYLIKKHNIVYNYSCNLWLNSLKKSVEYNKRPENLLAMAPVFDPDKMSTELNNPVRDIIYTNKMGAIDIPDLTPLPATKKAVDEICQLADNKQIKSLKFLYKLADKKSFKLEVADKKYVLIATHGRSDDENPKFSGLYFAPADSLKEQPEKVFLYSSEIYNLNLTSDLVVLYACETGIGQVKKGEGAMTISRGFIASGAANIVHTLWSIQDVSTKDLVVDLFKGVFNNKDYAASLRQAKLKMIEYGVIPFHWSGLVLLGH